MIVQCPNCQTKYTLPDERVGAEGARVRCVRCTHVFRVWPEADKPAEDLDDLLKDLGLQEPDGAAPLGDDAAGPDEAEDGGEPADSAFGQDGGEDEDGRGQGGGFRLPDLEDEPAPAGKPKRRTALYALLALAVLLAGAAGGLTWFKAWDRVPYLGGLTGQAEQPAQPAGTAEGEGQPAPEAVKSIALVDVSQYYVSNDKAGQIFVIDGKAVNNFDTPRSSIKVQASLFDDKGAVIATKDIVCGNTLSLYQLQVLGKDEIDAALASQVGILTANAGVKTGASVPFTVVFFDPPESVKEFGIKVVDAKP
jgi:predicted Zn finger-like uncharacterized protein